MRSQRKKLGMSQEKLAEKADLHPTYVSRVEGGVMNVSLDAMVRIAKALGTTIHELTKDF